MLSSIGRAATRRAGAGASQQSTNRVFQSLWHLQRVYELNNGDKSSSIHQFPLALRRAYATATEAAKSKPKASTKTATKAKPRKLATKKKTTTKPRKKPVKKVVKKKPKKKVAAKPKLKRKVLTEGQKEKAALLKQKAALKALKATALEAPKAKPSTAWAVLFSEHMANNTGTTKVKTTDAAAKYKTLSVSELEHFNHLANKNKAENETAYKNWIDTHTPEQIRLANNARNMLQKRAAEKGRGIKGKNLVHLVDPRLPKRPATAWNLFAQSRWQSGDFKGISVANAAKEIHKEWTGLSTNERKGYEDRQAVDSKRYVQEYKTVFGRDPSFIKKI